jgi:hypothetical protein
MKPSTLIIAIITMVVLLPDIAPAASRLAEGLSSQLSLSYLPAADLRGTTADAAMTDLRVRAARKVDIGSSVSLTIGGGYGLKHIDAPAAAALPSDLHSLFLDLGTTYRFDDRLSTGFYLYPGLFSDFGGVGSDDVRMPVMIYGTYKISREWTVTGGLIYRIGYHSANVIPAVGFSWQPNEIWRIDLLMPRPGVTYTHSRSIKVFAAGDFSSDEYQLHDRSYGADVIRYKDLKFTFGADYSPFSPLTLSASVGYAFDRKFDFYDGPRQRTRLDSVPFMKVSVGYSW